MGKEREREIKTKINEKRRREKYGKQQTEKREERKKEGKRDERLFRNEPMEFEAKHDPESLCIVNIYRGPFNEVREMDESFFFYSLFLFCYFFFSFFLFHIERGEENRINDRS